MNTLHKKLIVISLWFACWFVELGVLFLGVISYPTSIEIALIIVAVLAICKPTLLFHKLHIRDNP